MKLNVGYTHALQSDSLITINDADYLAWCHERNYPAPDYILLKDEATIIAYLNWDKQYLSELIGWGESNTIAYDINFEN